MPPSDLSTSPTKLSYRHRLDKTNSMIALANQKHSSSAIECLIVDLSDPRSPALSSPTFEALNRCTLAYAYAKQGSKDLAKEELKKVGRLIREDEGKTPYFEKIWARATRVATKRGLGTIEGVNDVDSTAATMSSPLRKSVPLDADLLNQLAVLDLDDGATGEEDTTIVTIS